MTTATRHRIARVVVTLHPSRRAEPLIDIATRLARAFEAEVAGLFIKDIDLINMAGLPFTRRLLSHGAVESLTTEMMEAALNRQAAGIERSLMARAEHQRLKCSFRAVTTAMGRVLEAAGEERDSVIIVETAGTDVSGPLSLARLAAASVSVLALPAAGLIEGPVVVLPHGSEAVLERAADVARATESRLIVVARSGDEKADLEGALRGLDVPADIRPDESGELGAMLRRIRPGLLVVERTDAEAVEAAEALGVPAFIVSP